MAVTKIADRRWTGELKDFTAKWNQKLRTLTDQVVLHQRIATNLIEACRRTRTLLEKSQKQMEQDRLELLQSAITEEEARTGAPAKRPTKTRTPKA